MPPGWSPDEPRSHGFIPAGLHPLRLYERPALVQGSPRKKEPGEAKTRAPRLASGQIGFCRQQPTWSLSEVDAVITKVTQSPSHALPARLLGGTASMIVVYDPCRPFEADPAQPVMPGKQRLAL